MNKSNLHNGETAKEREARWRREEQEQQKVEDALAIAAALDELRAEPGAGVTINCDNEEGSGPDNCAIDVCDAWTNWQPHRFFGGSLRKALEAAVAEKRLKHV